MRGKDTFFTTDRCDRCGSSPLVVRTMSWFTKEALCMACSDSEAEIKTKLREMGYTGAMEGCGYIPNPNELAGRM